MTIRDVEVCVTLIQLLIHTIKALNTTLSILGLDYMQRQIKYYALQIQSQFL